MKAQIAIGITNHKLMYSQATFAAQLFYILSLAAAKASIAALMLRLFPRDNKATRKAWILCLATLALTLLWTIGSIVAIAVGCSPNELLRTSSLDQCLNRVDRWRAIITVDILIECLLVLLAVAFLWPIQMKRHIKLQVVVAFSFRLPLVAFAGLHLHFIHAYARNPNGTKAIIPALICQQFQLFWSLLSATIPTLKAFMQSFNSGFGMEIEMNLISSSRSRGRADQGYSLGSTRPPPSSRKILDPTESRIVRQITLSQNVTDARGLPVRDLDTMKPKGSDEAMSHLSNLKRDRDSSIASDSSQARIIWGEAR